MSKPHTKIIDLEVCEDGTYVSKHDKKIVLKKVRKSKEKYDRREADDFLNGIDAGLDFLDEIVPRVDRFLKLRG